MKTLLLRFIHRRLLNELAEKLLLKYKKRENVISQNNPISAMVNFFDSLRNFYEDSVVERISIYGGDKRTLVEMLSSYIKDKKIGSVAFSAYNI